MVVAQYIGELVAIGRRVAPDNGLPIDVLQDDGVKIHGQGVAVFGSPETIPFDLEVGVAVAVDIHRITPNVVGNRERYPGRMIQVLEIGRAWWRERVCKYV